ncbi:hypothetical protein MRX96_037459 [Rhipicephalus microplus]
MVGWQKQVDSLQYESWWQHAGSLRDLRHTLDCRRLAQGGATASPPSPKRPGVMGLDAITTDSESVIDMMAEQYISAILPDPSTTIYATGQTSGHSANAPCSSYSAGDGCEEEPPVMSSPRRPP